jgi:hypothetical protein
VYAVTELLDGQNLATIIQEEGRISPGRAVHVASQVCRALGTAHESGIIHRDFKPSNIVLVAQEGDLDFVKVVDFGICSHVDSEPSTTSSQQELIIGSPDYMAPEQAAGAEANPASDIYALGSVLFEMLTGRLAYKGRNAIDVLIQKGARDASRVTEIAPDVPEGLADVIAACLSRRPEDRPSSMRVLEVDLLRALDSKAPRPVKSAVAAALAGAGVPRVDASERSGNSPLPPPPESASSSSMRAPINSPSCRRRARGSTAADERTQRRDAGGDGDRRRRAARAVGGAALPGAADAAGAAGAAGAELERLAVAGGRRDGDHRGGAVVPAAVRRRAGAAGHDASKDEVAAKTSADVEDPEELPEPEPQLPPPPPTKDPMVIVTRAELALGEGRLLEPPATTSSEYLQQLAALDAGNEAIARLRGKAVEDAAGEGDQGAGRQARARGRGSPAQAAGAGAREQGRGGAVHRGGADGEQDLAPHEGVGRDPADDRGGHEGEPQELRRADAPRPDAGRPGRWPEAVEAYKLATELRKKDKPAKAALAEAKKKAGGK